LESLIFRCGLDDDTIDRITDELGGKHVRITKTTSKYNPIYRRKRNKNICSEYENGELINEIAIEYNLCRMTIWRILKENNITTREKSKKAEREQIKTMLKLGYSVTQIQRETGVSRPTIYKLKKEGVRENE